MVSDPKKITSLGEKPGIQGRLVCLGRDRGWMRVIQSSVPKFNCYKSTFAAINPQFHILICHKKRDVARFERTPRKVVLSRRGKTGHDGAHGVSLVEMVRVQNENTQHRLNDCNLV